MLRVYYFFLSPSNLKQNKYDLQNKGATSSRFKAKKPAIDISM